MADQTETTNTAVIVKGVKVTKAVSISPFKGSPDSKKLTLVIDFDGCPLQSVFDKASSNDVISWQNNNRDKYDSLVDGSTIERDFSAPPSTVVSIAQGEQIVLAEMAGMSDDEKQAYLNEKFINA